MATKRFRDGAYGVASRIRGGFPLQLLGLALLVPLFEVFRRASFDLPRSLAQVCTPAGFVVALSLGAILCLGILLLQAARGKSGGCRREALAAASLGLVAFAGFFAVLFEAPPLQASVLRVIVSAFALACLGASLAVLLVGWLRAYARACDPLLVAPGVAASIFLGNLTQPLITLGLDARVMAAILLACVIASSALLATCDARREKGLPDPMVRTPDGAETPSPADGDAKSPVPVDGVDNAEIEHLPFSEIVRSSVTATALGFVLCFFTWGVMANPPQTFAADHNWLVYFTGNLAALVAMAAYAYSLRTMPHFTAMRQKAFFLLPVFAIFVAYFSFIRMLSLDMGGTLKDILSFGFNMAVPGFASLFAALAASRSREKGLAIELTAVPAVIGGCAVYVLGAAAYGVLGNSAMYIQVVAATLYIVGLSVISARHASLDDSQVERRCETLAQTHGLSAREVEILQLVAADYSVERIAEQLVISTSTVRTHKKRIYAKLDVHKHEDLMRLVRQR